MADQFNLFDWSRKIPFCDDTFFGMQARNIALVDQSIIRDIEEQAHTAYYERERTPIDILLPLNALSQMWCFSLYEFLRTWRQRADELLKIGATYNTKPSLEKEDYLRAEITKAELRNKHATILPSTYPDYIAQLRDFTFYKSLEEYRSGTEGLFREAEALRITLAKHEVPKTKGLFAEAPGYCRMDILTGSVYWPINLKDGQSIMINRRDLANAFLQIEDDVSPGEEE